MNSNATAAPPAVIRRLGIDDLQAYKALRDAVLAAYPSAFTSDAAEVRVRTPESYRSRLGLERPEGGEFTLGAWQGEALVGAISSERDARVKVRHIGHIVGMMVSDRHQRHGIGAALLAACITEARGSDGLEMLTLTVTAGNSSAIRLYEAAGFGRCGRLQRAICVDGRYFDKDQMVLVLPKV
jgi:ribosomal protein S18 acetylase RimI-like enzyme